MESQPDLDLLSPGATIRDRYVVVRRLKAGGMGAVYEVLDRETSRRRAMKTLLPSFVADADMRARFQLEVRVAANVESDHVVEIFDAGVDEPTGLPFLVMELLRGESLASALERRGRLPPEEVVLLLHQASLALDRTHAAGIVHRDLKPDNLFLTARDDGSPRLKLLDFGIAKVASQTTRPGTTRNLGTPLYMSPEQIRGDGDIGPAADLYSLAHIAYCLLVGRPYWSSESQRSGGVYSLLVKVAEGAVEPATTRAKRAGASLPPPIDAWFSRATARLPAERFASASELVEKLASALGVPVPGSVALLHATALATNDKTVPAGGSSGAGGDSTGALSSPRPSTLDRRSRSALGVLLFAAVVVAAGVTAHVTRGAPASVDTLAPAFADPVTAVATASYQQAGMALPEPSTPAEPAPRPTVTTPRAAPKAPPARIPPKEPRSTRNEPSSTRKEPSKPSDGEYDPTDVR